MDEEIPLDVVVDAARRRAAALTAEVAGYVLLLLAQQNNEDCREPGMTEIFLSSAGEVRRGAGKPAPATLVEAQLRELLGALLSFSQSPAPALERVVRRPANGSLERLAHELAAALIPINHAASRRALARLYRETRRLSLSPTAAVKVAPIAARAEPAPLQAPPTAVALQPQPSPAAAELDIDIDVELLRQSSMPPANAPSVLQNEPSACHSDVDELLGRFLADTRSEQRMAAALRELVGIGAASVRNRSRGRDLPAGEASEHAA